MKFQVGDIIVFVNVRSYLVNNVYMENDIELVDISSIDNNRFYKRQSITLDNNTRLIRNRIVPVIHLTRFQMIINKC